MTEQHRGIKDLSRLTREEVASRVDHTLLRADATSAEVDRLCDEAMAHSFAGVCINSAHLPQVVARLKGSSVKAVCVVGFPLGAMATPLKVAEARWASEQGAQEIDMVLSIGALKDGELQGVEDEIRAVVHAALPGTVKVILETASLTKDEKVTACLIAEKAGAAFVKTSTGFGKGGATEEDVRLMRATVGPSVRVKASGGIKTWEDAVKMIQAGADRLGTSSGVSLIQGPTSGGSKSDY